MDLPVGQGAASASPRSPVTKENYEFIINPRLGQRGSRRRCFEHTRAEITARGRGRGAGRSGSCRPSCQLSPHSWRDPGGLSQCPRSHSGSCPREAHGEAATVLVGEGHGLESCVPSARRSAAPRGWRRIASLLPVEKRQTPRNGEGKASPEKCFQVPPIRYLHPEGQ